MCSLLNAVSLIHLSTIAGEVQKKFASSRHWSKEKIQQRISQLELYLQDLQSSQVELQANGMALEILEMNDHHQEFSTQLAKEENQLNALVLHNEILSVQAEMAELRSKLPPKSDHVT